MYESNKRGWRKVAILHWICRGTNKGKSGMNKPIVHYKRSSDNYHYIKVGQSALVVPVDHPSPNVSNEDIVHTSTVISYDEQTGEFETKNTIYKPIYGNL